MLSVRLVGFFLEDRIKKKKEMDRSLLSTNSYKTNNQLIDSHYLDTKNQSRYDTFIRHIIVATEIFFA